MGRKKVFKLKEVLQPLTDTQIKDLKMAAVQRILQAERYIGGSGAAQVRNLIVFYFLLAH